MNKLFKPLALIGLGLTVLPPLLLFLEMQVTLPWVKNFMFAGMVLWFLAAIPWLAFNRKDFDRSTRDEI